MKRRDFFKMSGLLALTPLIPKALTGEVPKLKPSEIAPSGSMVLNDGWLMIDAENDRVWFGEGSPTVKFKVISHG